MCLVLLAALTPARAAFAAGPQEVDESRLVPTLSSSFAARYCTAKLTGPVCIGERQLGDDWAPIPDVCDVLIWGSRVEHRYQTRYYNHDYLNYYREFRTNDVDYLST